MNYLKNRVGHVASLDYRSVLAESMKSNFDSSPKTHSYPLDIQFRLAKSIANYYLIGRVQRWCRHHHK